MLHDGRIGTSRLLQLLQLMKRPAEVALKNLLPEVLPPLEVGPRQLIHATSAQLLTAHRLDEFVHILCRRLMDARELAQRIHEGPDGEASREDFLPDPRAHLFEQPKAHTDPCRASLELSSDLLGGHLMFDVKLGDELCLFDQVET